jgi:hypothetical protein
MAIIVFFALATGLSAVVLVTVLVPGGWRDALWRVNPAGRQAFAAMGGWAVVLMVTVCGTCAAATIGLWRRRRWGWLCAVGILAVQLVGDLFNGVLRHDPRTLIGLPIAGLMLLYLCSARVRRMVT